MITKKTQLKFLQKDVEDVLVQKKQINKRTNNKFDTSKVLGIVATKDGAEKYLSYTIPKIINQINDSGFSADIVIGLNNGFECPSVVKELTSKTALQLIHLYTTDKIERDIPALIFDNKELRGIPYRIKNIDNNHKKNRIFFVHQKSGTHTPGKVRILLDIYQLLLDSLTVGWVPPLYTIIFDAESMFLVNRDNTNLDIQSNGLKLFINEIASNSRIDILGAIVRNAVYKEQVMTNKISTFWPEFSKAVPPIHLFLNLVHGKYYGYCWKPGGGTIGKTDVIISLLFVISKTYPGTIGEDLLTTILAHHAGFQGNICKSVIITNRCNDDNFAINNDRFALIGKKQLERWFTARYVLEKKYGKKNVRLISGYSKYVTLGIILTEIFKEVKKRNINCVIDIAKKIRHLLSAMPVLKMIKKDVRISVAKFNDSGDKAYW